MKKDRNRKNLNTKAFAAATVLGVGAIAAAHYRKDIGQRALKAL